MNILILGGTGFVGSTLVERLVTHCGGAGARIVVPSRRPQRAAQLRTLPTVDVVAADVHDEVQLLRLVIGCDAVINLVAILHGSAAAFERTHATLPATLARVCAEAGVRRVLHVSALGVAADAPSRYLRSKAAGEAALRAGDLDLTVLRPSVIFGSRDRFMNLFARLQALAPVVPLAGAGSTYQPVWVEDVAEALLRSLLDPATIGATYECAGPRVYTLAELVTLAGRWSGHPRPVLPLPDAVGRLQAALMALAPGEPLMSGDNLDSMKLPNVATGRLPGLDALGITATALEAVAPGYLGPSRAETRFEAWRALARRR
ncbi:MAG TPA: complex I NDUFA9 subunit family protein [Methylibium sp.]|nr:complex I NDUFA9 subunit family protein [Methylibium sp.]